MMLLLALFLALVPIAAQASEDVSTPNVDPATDWEKSSAPEAREELPHQATASQCCDMEILKGALSELVQEQREARGWYAEMVKVLTQLVQENKELGSNQMEVLKVLRVMKDQQEQQLSHLMSFARLQSLLVENHQALLFQVSRISSQIQEVTKKPSQ